jgi:hypothetical protein
METGPAPSGSSGREHRGRDRSQPTGKRRARAKAAGQRFRTLNAFVDFTAGGLRRNELLVWLILYRDTRDGVARTSQADLARRAGVSKRTVIRVVRKLVDRGLLVVVYRGSIQQGPSGYRVLPVAGACP